MSDDYNNVVSKNVVSVLVDERWKHMRIPGAGGVQDIRIYEVAFQDAWELIFDCLNDIGIDVDERDEEHHVIHGHRCSCSLTSIKNILKCTHGNRITVTWTRFTNCMSSASSR